MKKILTAAVLIMAMLAISLPMAVPAFAQGGFDQYGYNDGARLFNGWYGYYLKDISNGTGNIRLVMKWSKDWTPMGDEPVGAWCTNHWTWYTDNTGNLEGSDWFGFYSPETWTDVSNPPSANYMVTENLKIMRVSNNYTAWLTYQAGGAYDAYWGDYSDGVPKYVVFQDVVTVTQLSNGAVTTYNICTAPSKGLGQPIF